jgi:hypothetical protein
MYRSILIGLAAAIALAAMPSLAASDVSTTTEDWEQAARAYSSYAFGNPVTTTEDWEQAARAYSGYAFGNPVAPTGGAGADDVETGSIVEDDAPRIDVQAFCDGEGKLLAERLDVSFLCPAP